MHNKIKILITGATGFTGGYVVQEFLSHGDTCDISILARDKNKVAALGYTTLPLRIKYGSFEDESSFFAACKGMDALINIASLGFGHADAIVRGCTENNIGRALFISSTSIFTHLNPASKNIRVDAEDRIQKSGIKYTILRPTMIFGARGDRNIFKLIRYVNTHRMIPVPGSGKFLSQPLYVKDLARAVFLAFTSEAAVNQTYDTPGRDALTFNSLLDCIARELNKKIITVHVPLWLCMLGFKLFETSGVHTPFSLEQIKRLNEHKNFSCEKAQQDFGFAPISFIDAIRQEIAEFKSIR